MVPKTIVLVFGSENLLKMSILEGKNNSTS